MVEEADAVVTEQMEFFPRLGRVTVVDGIKAFSNFWAFNRIRQGDFRVPNLERNLDKIAEVAGHYEEIFKERNFGITPV